MNTGNSVVRKRDSPGSGLGEAALKLLVDPVHDDRILVQQALDAIELGLHEHQLLKDHLFRNGVGHSSGVIQFEPALDPLETLLDPVDNVPVIDDLGIVHRLVATDPGNGRFNVGEPQQDLLVALARGGLLFLNALQLLEDQLIRDVVSHQFTPGTAPDFTKRLTESRIPFSFCCVHTQA